jgi:hypothetical protein
LSVGTNYTFTVVAQNRIGSSAQSSRTASISISAPPEVPSEETNNPGNNGNEGDTPPPPAEDRDAVDAARAAALAAAQREAAAALAPAQIANRLQRTEELTIDFFKNAGIVGVTAKNIAEVQAEILALPAASRTDIKQVQKVVRRYEVVDLIASERIKTVPTSVFVETELIPASSKNKASLVAAVRRVAVSDRDTFVEIQAIILAETARIKERKDRLAAIIYRNATRYQSIGLKK